MTLIPVLLNAMIPVPANTSAVAGANVLVRGSYNPGGGHRPVAAMLAIGLPAVLVVAVALSPMVMTKAPRIDDTIVKSIPIEKPETLPTPPIDKSQPPPPTAPTMVPPLVVAPTFDPPITQLPLGPPVTFGPVDTGPPVKAAIEPKLVAAVIDPRYAGVFQPDYPAYEQRNDVEGVVKVRVLIGRDGRVKAVEQVSSASPGFFTETRRRALSKWRFKPATRDGVPYESWQVMTVRFELRGA